MTRVLMCGPFAKAGGVSAHTVNLTQSLLTLGSNIITYNFLGGSRKDLEPSEVNAFTKTYYRTFGLLFEAIRRRKEYDIIHIQTSGGIFSFISSISGVIASKLMDKYCIVTFHFSWVEFYKKYSILLNFVIRYSDVFITVSERNKNLLSKYVADDCISKIKVIPNGYDDSLFKPYSKEYSKCKLKIPQESIVLVNIANLLPHKGQSDLIKAVDLLKQKFQIDNIICYIVGDGPIFSQLKDLIKKHSLEERVILTGRVPLKSLPVYLNSSNLFVFSSLSNGESFGIVQVEAMGCRIPIVATKNGASEEIIISENYGLLCEPSNPKDMAHKILLALNKKWDYKGIESYAKQYSWHRIANQILDEYDKL